jgi:hypothetical protein
MNLSDPTKRGQHPKGHGCVKATFTVLPPHKDFKKEYRVGLFKEAKPYDAIIRFSNGSVTDDDRNKDIHGIAIKVIVDKDRAVYQDFLMVDSETFFAPDVKTLLALLKATRDTKLGDKKALPQFIKMYPDTFKRFKDSQRNIPSPLTTQYWSDVPYRLGEGATKYTAIPTEGNGPKDGKLNSPNYLREAMVEQLTKKEAVFDFYIIPRTNAEKMPIEDPTVSWGDEKIKVATIKIEPQIFDTPELQKECEELSFSPWHALEEHRPLGGINRARKVVYPASLDLRERQGWNAVERWQFYTLPQGSFMLPYKWFLHLEQATNAKPFRSDEHMRRLRYLPWGADPKWNPDGLPVGFAREPWIPAPPGETGWPFKHFLGPASDVDFSGEGDWVGLNCAACHTTEIHHKGKQLRIDGGPALADLAELKSALSQALLATVWKKDKFKRFADKVLGEAAGEDARAALRKKLETYAIAFRAYVNRNTPAFAHGFGRMDAFGGIMNEVFGTALGIPANYGPVDAPVNYIDLWYTPQLSWVEWNGSGSNPFARNIGVAIGTFGHVGTIPPPPEGLASTVRGENLFKLEQLVWKLEPPKWDEAVLGKIDPEKVRRGRKLYRVACAECHAEKEPYPRTPPNLFDKEFIRVKMVSLEKIGTDPKMATNFAKRMVLPGALGKPGDQPQLARLLLQDILASVLKRQFTDLKPKLKLTPQDILQYNGFREVGETPPDLLAYRARPLAGVWATAPYLHNGSVPNLYELLLPPKQRSPAFYLGRREFDPKRVGFVTEETPGAFLFDTTLPGNANTGHAYGTSWMTDDQRWDLIEYLKTF